MKFRLCFVVTWCLLTCILTVICAKTPKGKRTIAKADDITAHDVQSIVGNVCFKARTDRLVYRYQNDSHIFIGFDIPKQGVVEFMTWEMKENNREVLVDRRSHHYDVIPAEDIRATLLPEHVLAVTNSRAQREFRNEVENICQSTSIITLDCIIQVFAACARRFKPLNLDPTCLQRSSHKAVMA